VLDVRDYKTGARRHDRVADDPRARVQAWVLGREAQHRGLRLQLRYEHLAPEVDEDPEPWEPEADDLAAVDEELRTFAAALWAEERWAGEHDPGVCGPCRYRSLCVDSAAPGRPAWPILAGDPVGEDPGSDR
jgi:hypothetical protein